MEEESKGNTETIKSTPGLFSKSIHKALQQRKCDLYWSLIEIFILIGCPYLKLSYAREKILIYKNSHEINQMTNKLGFRHFCSKSTKVNHHNKLNIPNN